jgi:Ca2+-binding RTX toxin-like protein
MTNYVFETITDDQAASYQSATDNLGFSATGATALQVLVTPEISTGGVFEGVLLSDPADGISKQFGPGLQGEAITFPDGSHLFIGNDGSGDNVAGGGGGDVFYGFGGDDSLVGGAGSDLIYGNLGGDTLSGGAGSDSLFAGKGDDLILATGNGGADHDQVNGNMGDDTINSDGAGSTINGGQGDDLIIDGAGANLISGDLGNDSISGGGGDDTLLGGGGDDQIRGVSTGKLVIHGGDGGDVVTVDFSAHSGLFDINGDAGDDTITAHDHGAGLSVYHGGDGNDLITLDSSAGFSADTAKQVYGDDGADSIADYNTTNDVLFGGAGDDTIAGLGDGVNSAVWSIDAGDGNDTVVVDHSHTPVGTPANVADVILLGAGNDTFEVVGRYGTESVDGGDGDDLITASIGTSRDTLLGGAGNDTIDASLHGNGMESLNGGAGDDLIKGGYGKDIMYGGGGVDTFSFEAYSSNNQPGSLDEIRDWDPHDKLMFASGAGSADNYTEYAGAQAHDYASALSYAQQTLTQHANLQYVAIQVGSDVVLFANDGGAGDAVLLVGRSLGDIDSSNLV